MASSRYKHDRGSSCTTKLLTLCIILLFVAAAAVSIAYLVIRARRPTIGVNYGRIADNLPPPGQVVAIIKRLKIGRVKIYDANPQVVAAFANSGVELSVMVTNQEVQGIASSQVTADQWVQQNVVAWIKTVKITTVVVGNEILSDYSNQGMWGSLVPAMQNLQSSLVKAGLGSIMVTSAIAVDCLATSFPPSNGTFRQDIVTSVIQPMLQFLSSTNSYFFVNVYPYFAWADNLNQISLPYATFGSSTFVVSDGSYRYTDLLDAQIDALISAMAKVGYQKVKITISETGWPTQGDPGQPGANITVAADFNRRLVRKVLWKPSGTPMRPGVYIPTYIFSLFNEDLKSGPTTERNWGLLYPNGSSVYAIDLTGREKLSDYVSSAPFQVTLPAVPQTSLASNNSSSQTNSGDAEHSLQQPNKTGDVQWCIANASTEAQNLKKGLEYACSKIDCTAIQPGQACFKPNTLAFHASYAFNKFYQVAKNTGESCSFNGSAVLTTNDPSSGSCTYPVP